MKNNPAIYLITFLLLAFSMQQSFAGENHLFSRKSFNPNFFLQNDSTKKENPDTTKDKKDRQLSLELDYGSNQTFKGRKSDVKQPYYSPILEYEAPSGFFIYISFTNIITKEGSTDTLSVEAKEHKIDEFTINPGYDFKIGKKTDASIGISLYKFYDTAMINYGINWNLEYSMDHDFKFINEKIIFDFDKGRTPTPNDFMISLETYHSFDIDPLFGKEDELSIKPDFIIETGTQNFYTRKRRIIQRNSSYTILAYDFSLDISYSIGKFTIDAAINYSIPVNQPAGQQTKPYGYLTLALIWDFL
jgi:hypothetical protein